MFDIGSNIVFINVEKNESDNELIAAYNCKPAKTKLAIIDP